MEGSIRCWYKLITKYNFTIIYIMLNSVSKKKKWDKKSPPHYGADEYFKEIETYQILILSAGFL